MCSSGVWTLITNCFFDIFVDSKMADCGKMKGRAFTLDDTLQGWHFSGILIRADLLYPTCIWSPKWKWPYWNFTIKTKSLCDSLIELLLVTNSHCQCCNKYESWWTFLNTQQMLWNLKFKYTNNCESYQLLTDLLVIFTCNSLVYS